MDLESYTGTVIWFNPKKGFGFIDWNKNGQKQKDIFLHFSDICCDGFKTIKQGQLVSFSIGVNNKNEPKAIEIKIL